jgi:hypothetical protein
VKKSTKARGEFVRCPKCHMEYTQNADGALDPAGSGVPTPAERRSWKKDGAASGRHAAPAKAVKKAAKKAAAKRVPAKAAAGTKPASRTAKKSAARKPGKGSE